MQNDGDAPCQSPTDPSSNVSLDPTTVYARGQAGVPDGDGVAGNTDTGVTDTVGVMEMVREDVGVVDREGDAACTSIGRPVVSAAASSATTATVVVDAPLWLAALLC